MKSQLRQSVLLIVLALFLPVSADAQSDFVKAHGMFLSGASKPAPDFKLDVSYQPNVGIEDSSLEADLVRVDSRIRHVHALNEDVALVGAVHFGLRRYNFDGSLPGGANLDTTLYEIAIELGVNWFVSERILVSAIYRPGIFSDLDLDDHLRPDDFLYQGTVIGTYQLNDHWFLKLGVAVGEDFDQTLVTPIGGFSWVSSDQLRVDILLPKSASLTWQPWANRSFEIVPGVYLEGRQYHVHQGSDNGDIQIQDVRFDVTGSFEVAEGERLSLSVGSNFRGQYESEGLVNNFDVDQDPSLYIAVGFEANF